MAKGTINVETKNIFPIIKKFLYSDHEIFLRELISNAVDATQKMTAIANRGDANGELGDTTIEIKINKKKKTLHVIDKGIGMTEEEVEKYINQIAFSSAEEFLDKYKDDLNVIGHFGLGFYSSFMVADKVEIKTLSYKEGAEAVKWECDGDPEYSLGKAKKKERGTEIILHINDENKEFLEEYRVRELLNKYCKFLPVPIQFGEKEVTEKDEKDKEKKVKKPDIINNTTPAWTKAPADLTDEDYKDFYRELYPISEPPLFWIHLNVDYPFKLTGILYFPKVNNSFEVQKNKIQLYSNQVFVTDEVKEIVPEWLTLLHGVIDSPDIPLNVSRSYLQSDPNVKKINSHITKKVADKLEELFKNERESFEEKWSDISLFVKYGMLSDEKFVDRAEKFALLKDIDGKHYTFEEWKKAIEETQTDKDKNIVSLYTTDKDNQYSYIAGAKQKGYKVVEMDTMIDPHWMGMVEQKHDKWTFKRVDADTLDKLIEKDEAATSLLTEKEQETVKKQFESSLGEQTTYTVELKPMSTDDQPVVITQSEQMRRMKEMSQLSGNSFMGQMPDMYNLVVNTNHPVINKLLQAEGDKQQNITQQLIDIALLGQGLLKGEKLSQFIQRSVNLIDEE